MPCPYALDTPISRPGHWRSWRVARLPVAAAASLGVAASAPVSFWTEASLFTEAGLTAFVCGPGDIDQAHTTDEWVARAQLEAARTIYAGAMTRTGGVDE